MQIPKSDQTGKQHSSQTKKVYSSWQQKNTHADKRNRNKDNRNCEKTTITTKYIKY